MGLPFPAAGFDAVCLLHVGMNIQDKDTLCAELARVLRPGGICGIYDVMRSGEGQLNYPVPWASSPAISFLAAPDNYRHCLTQAGLQVTGQGRLSPGPHLLMGKDFTANGQRDQRDAARRDSTDGDHRNTTIELTEKCG